MSEHQYHYQVIRRAIEIIDAQERAELSLPDLAAQLNMSPAHFQRVFSRWVGVSPKRYHQYLTLGHARALLRERFTTLETTGSLGLSGTSRLHDLFIRWEAMSPGEYAARGAGLTIRHGWFESPFGDMLAMATDRGLCGLAFSAETGRDAALADMGARWPEARHVEDPAAVAPLVERVLDGQEARLHLCGGPFQIKVWEALMAIPSGQVSTYSEIASRIGSPRAVRAVGTAVGRNPISWLIPCHRALRKSGGLGGYHWGLPVKRAMLAHEAARAEAGYAHSTEDDTAVRKRA
jgi:AraC family transcriptional regulator of adaptative response/methylated-DNA-[protein]-cysteine methyltransferase